MTDMAATAATAATGPGPLVSVVMCAYRAAATLPAAIASVLRQSCRNLELIVVDDASGDASCDIVRDLARADPRVRLLALGVNRGAAAARNGALDIARGEWVAIVDSDDLIHPRRFERLIAAAEARGADMVADDMVPFSDDPGTGGGTLFSRMAGDRGRLIDATAFVRSDLSGGTASLGYCKPLFRRRALGQMRYDETVGIGEDFDFCLRLLMAGRSLLLWPDPSYLYRRHAGSLSHRLSVDQVARQIAAQDRLAVPARQDRPGLRAALDARRERLDRALAYERLVAAIRSRDLTTALRALIRRPALGADLLRSVDDRRRRRRSAGQSRETGPIRLRLLAEGVCAPPPDGGVDLTVPGLPAGRPAVDHAALAGRLAALHGRAPLDVTVRGAGALHGLGYLPGARRIRVELLHGEELPDPDGLPPLHEVRCTPGG
jgi:succinoglycan biosynthesis protein ExoO